MNGADTAVPEIEYLTTYENNKHSIDNLIDGKAFEN